MPYKYSIDPSTKTVFFAATGVFSSEELFSCIVDVFEDPLFQPGFKHLVDMSGLEDSFPSTDKLHERIRADKQSLDRFGNTKIAFIAPPSATVVYGMLRLYITMMEDTSIEMEIFDNAYEARQWLELAE